MPDYDAAGRTIAGLLTYNPGPGIYSRLERAIQAMPENVRTQELPGLLKRYKDGVPGWELKETDLDSVIAGRDVVPREELLARVKERSPVYTHKEVVLADTPPMETIPGAFGGLPHYQDEASAIGRGIAHGDPKYQDYGQGGRDYTEILLTQPGARSAGDYGNHWGQAATQATSANRDAVAHARFDTHGDALRINELQSDLGIHNRKMRERLDKTHATSEADYPLPFPLEDAWSDILIKRLALEAAQKGHRAIEVASPRAIADKVGGNIDNYEHLYGKVVPGALERLGRKMGGLTAEAPQEAVTAGNNAWHEDAARLHDEIGGYMQEANWGHGGRLPYTRLVDAIESGDGTVGSRAQRLYQNLMREGGLTADEAASEMTLLMSLAERQAKAQAAYRIAHHSGVQIGAANSSPPGRRYIMSDEMRRRILQEGIPAAVAVGIGADNLIDRLDREQR
jgi:hypothetical protein